MDGGPLAPTTGATARVSGVSTPQGGLQKGPEDTEHGARGGEEEGKADESSMATAPEPSAAAAAAAKQVAPMRNLYTAALSYNGYTVTDGALRLIVLLHAADLGYVCHQHYCCREGVPPTAVFAGFPPVCCCVDGCCCTHRKSHHMIQKHD